MRCGRFNSGQNFSHGFILVLIATLTGLSWAQLDTNQYRLCIPEVKKHLCEEMVQELAIEGGRITCVLANDKIGCIEKVVKNEADFLPLEPEEIYLAQRFRASAFSVISEIRMEEFQNRDYRYEPVAVIRRSSGINSISDLRGKRSCHTGFGRNAGWKIPFSHLMDRNELPKLCEEINAPTPERDLYTISKYFSKTCAPGPWVPEKEADAVLREKYPSLCELCENKRECNGNDKYAGYEGALKCLSETGADVAWTKMDAVEKFFKLNSRTPSAIVSDYAFLCWDGSHQPITANNTCSWAKRPWRAFIASSRISAEGLKDLQLQIDMYRGHAAIPSFQPSWAVQVLEVNATGEIVVPYPPHEAKSMTPGMYLSSRNYSVTIEKPSCSTSRVVRFCLQNEIEKLKCMDIRMGAISRRIVPGFDCILGDNRRDCMKKIQSGVADVMVVSAKTANRAEREFGLKTILSELELIDEATLEKSPFRYAVAVIRSDLSIRNITELRGKKSCHGSIRSLAGWNVPMNVLRQAQLLPGPTCGLTLEMAKFFNASCVPGALDAKKKMGWLPESLCELCAGDSSPDSTEPRSPNTFCQDNDAERYHGDVGALRCLVDQVADVAFIDHVELVYHAKEVIVDLKDIQLLCSNGEVRDVTQFKTCNWGKVPSRKVISRGGDDHYIEREDARLSLLKLSEQFSPLSGRSKNVLNLFGSYYENPNLIFQDTSVGLADNIENAKLSQLITDYDYCTTSTAAILSSRLVQSLTLALLFLMTRI